jgi:WD40 repeat protein
MYQCPGMTRFVCGMPQQEQSKLVHFTRRNLLVVSVAFSSDRKRIASTSSGCIVRVWDAGTGEVKTGPFIGHIYWVLSVAFSLGSQHIASASSDRTIRVWHITTATGRVVAGPFTGYIESVKSVALSPDTSWTCRNGDIKRNDDIGKCRPFLFFSRAQCYLQPPVTRIASASPGRMICSQAGMKPGLVSQRSCMDRIGPWHMVVWKFVTTTLLSISH